MPPQRLFVGDVQGCADELDEMLDRAEAHFGNDYEVWLVGDLVNRGPYNLRVLRRVRSLVDAGRGRCVLGNHEINLVRVAAGLRDVAPRDTLGDVLEAADARDWVDWLRRQPLAAEGRLGDQDFAMVHAAALPEAPLAELAARARRVEGRLAGDWDDAVHFLGGARADDPDRDTLARLTTCRSAARDGSWSPQDPAAASDGGEFSAWTDLFAERDPGYGVVYGHWARRGLYVAPWLRGLDTGCVHHGRGRVGVLTAWVPDPSEAVPFDVPDERFWHVRARRAYYAEGIGEKSD